MLDFLSRALSFRHGVHPPEAKDLTSGVPIRRMPFPDEVVLPLRQNAGAPARPLVKPGDRVERGDKIGEAQGFVSVPIHASAAGVVKAVELRPHPDGSWSDAVVIEVDRYSAQVPRPRIVPEWEGLTPAQVRKAVQEAGVVGLGGAAFPTHVKLSPPDDMSIELLLVNGAECEPYLTSDHRVMVEHPERVHFGIRIMMQCLGVDRCVIGVEMNKPDAIEALERTIPADLDITVQPLRVKYPQGAEKMLIHSVTGREVPSGKLPMHVGSVVQNVGSIAAIAEVFETGYPLIERIVTVTGPGVNKPSNLLVPVGTKIGDVLAFCDGLTDDAREVVFGGPMMGQSQPDMGAPVLKGTSGVTILVEGQVRPRTVLPCISCGHCLDACPVFLNPTKLGKLAQVGRYGEMVEHQLMDCMLCGSCSYVCPSSIPLAQMFALSKGAFRREQEFEKKKEEEAAAAAVEAGGKSGVGAGAGTTGGSEGRVSAAVQHPRLQVEASPHIQGPDSTARIMWSVVASLVPVVGAAAWIFGISAILVIAAATLGAVATERLMGTRPGSLADGSAAITGLLLGLTLPAGLPLWMAFTGGAFGIGFGKVIFGGLGQNVFNPALLGRAFLQAAFPGALTTWPVPVAEAGSWWALRGPNFALPLMGGDATQGAVDAVTGATPLGLMKFERITTPAADLFMGDIAGSLGETSALLILLGGAYLAWKGYLNWRIPVSVFLVVGALSSTLHLFDPARFPGAPFMLLSGGLMLGAVYMATDMVTSPVTNKGAWVFGAGIGFLVVVIRLWGGLPEGVMYAILLMNALVPFIDRATQPRVFGTGRRMARQSGTVT